MATEIQHYKISSFEIYPFKGSVDAVTYYGYDTTFNSSAAFEEQETMATTIYLYEDITTGNLSLHVVLDAYDNTNSTSGEVIVTIGGLPSSASIVVQDDPGDDYTWIDSSTVEARFSWSNCCTDGMVLDGINDFSNLSINVDPNNAGGVDKFKAVSSNNEIQYTNFSESTTLQIDHTTEQLDSYLYLQPEPSIYTDPITITTTASSQVAEVIYTEDGSDPTLSEYLAYDNQDPPNPFIAVVEDGLGNVLFDGGFPKWFDNKWDSNWSVFSDMSATFKYLANALEYISNTDKVQQGNKDILILGDANSGENYNIKDSGNSYFNDSFSGVCSIMGYNPTFKTRSDYGGQLDMTFSELNQYSGVILLSSKNTSSRFITQNGVDNMITSREQGNGILLVTDHGDEISSLDDARNTTYSGYFRTANYVAVRFNAYFTGDVNRSDVNVGYLRTEYGDHPLWNNLSDSEDIPGASSESSVVVPQVTTYPSTDIPLIEMDTDGYHTYKYLLRLNDDSLVTESYTYGLNVDELVEIVDNNANVTTNLGPTNFNNITYDFDIFPSSLGTVSGFIKKNSFVIGDFIHDGNSLSKYFYSHGKNNSFINNNDRIVIEITSPLEYVKTASVIRNQRDLYRTASYAKRMSFVNRNEWDLGIHQYDVLKGSLKSINKFKNFKIKDDFEALRNYMLDLNRLPRANTLIYDDQTELNSVLQTIEPPTTAEIFSEWGIFSVTNSSQEFYDTTSNNIVENPNVYASSTNNDLVYKLDSSGSIVWTFSNHTAGVGSVTVDSDGNVYSGSFDQTVRKISSSGNEIWQFTNHTGSVYGVKVDQNGNVYSGSSDYTVRKIDSSGNEIWQFTNHTGNVLSVAVDQNGNVYSGSSDNTVRKIDSSGNELWQFTNHTSTVYSVAVDQNGNVYSGSQDNTVRKIDSSGNELWQFTNHTDTVYSIAVDQNGNVYSGSFDDTVRKIDSSGNELWQFNNHTNSVYSIAVDQNGNVYSGSQDNTVRKIDSSGNELWQYDTNDDMIFSMAVDPGTLGAGFWSTSNNTDDTNVYAGSLNNDLVYKLDSSGNELWQFSNHTDNVTSVAVDSDGNVYSCSTDDTVRKIDSSGNEIWSFTNHTDSVRSVAVDQNGNVYSGSVDDTVRKIDSSGNEIWSFTNHTLNVRSVAVDQNGNVYSGGADNTVRKIDSSGNELWSFTNHTSPVDSVVVDQNGNVYSGSQDNTVRKIDSSGNELWGFYNHTGIVRSVAVDQNGNVYSGSDDDTVRKIDSSGNELWRFTNHTLNVRSVIVDQNGNVYSGSADQTVRKIDSSGNELWSFTNNDYIMNVAVDPGTLGAGFWSSSSSGVPNTSPFNSWAYDETNDRVIQTDAVDSYTGFVSNIPVETYTHEVTLTSPDSDDDAIGVVIAHEWDGSRNIDLSAIVTMGGIYTNDILSVISNTSASDQQVIATRQHDTVSSSPNSGPGWNSREIKVKIERDGDFVRVIATKWDDVNNYDPNSEIVLDLNSSSELQQHRGLKSYGYSTRSQADSRYIDIAFTGGLNYELITDGTNGIGNVYKDGSWESIGTSLQNIYGYPRILLNPKTGKEFLIQQNSLDAYWGSLNTIEVIGKRYYSGSDLTFTILNYNSNLTYTFTPSLGSITQNGNEFTWSLSSFSGSQTLTIDDGSNNIDVIIYSS